MGPPAKKTRSRVEVVIPAPMNQAAQIPGSSQAEEAEDAASAAAPLAALGQILPVTSRASVGMVVSIVS